MILRRPFMSIHGLNFYHTVLFRNSQTPWKLELILPLRSYWEGKDCRFVLVYAHVKKEFLVDTGQHGQSQLNSSSYRNKFRFKTIPECQWVICAKILNNLRIVHVQTSFEALRLSFIIVVFPRFSWDYPPTSDQRLIADETIYNGTLKKDNDGSLQSFYFTRTEL